MPLSAEHRLSRRRHRKHRDRGQAKKARGASILAIAARTVAALKTMVRPTVHCCDDRLGWSASSGPFIRGNPGDRELLGVDRQAPERVGHGEHMHRDIGA
ncbi:hypothetical protein QM806_27625 [Rhodococcus sp. IEGM 1351]|uniref:hypothetical protein n=1 Tax=Rhodococcus sp. IEGM 1351 TaxID=3047089 RepID=UPI0024B65727|nr:hypothetical protein [Rhodococcus sp. IEGM 1351]MDI9939161.1 hypothetical protein [Rhodococcus sp. IEGM 1351]